MPDVEGVGEDAETNQKKCGSEEQTYFEIDVVEDALELWVRWKKALLRAEDAGADGEDRDVGSDEDEAESVGEGVDIEGPATDCLWAGDQPEREDDAEEKCEDAGIEKEPAWTKEKKEAKVTPAVAPGAEMRRPRKKVTMPG